MGVNSRFHFSATRTTQWTRRIALYVAIAGVFKRPRNIKVVPLQKRKEQHMGLVRIGWQAVDLSLVSHVAFDGSKRLVFFRDSAQKPIEIQDSEDTDWHAFLQSLPTPGDPSVARDSAISTPTIDDVG